jgi:pantetheine-phosphate adenylyltransferase
MKSALYPGTFDPLTNGHLDLIQRSLSIFDRVVVAIAHNPQKKPLFSVAERVEMIELVTRELTGVKVVAFDGLLIDLAKAHQVDAIIRGLRAVSDFEYELQIALINRKLCPEIETVFMMPSGKYAYLSSRIVKEVAAFGGCIKGFVPEVIERRLRHKLQTS